MRAERPEILTLLCVLHFITLPFSAFLMGDAVITRINAIGPLAIQLDLRILKYCTVGNDGSRFCDRHVARKEMGLACRIAPVHLPGHVAA